MEIQEIWAQKLRVLNLNKKFWTRIEFCLYFAIFIAFSIIRFNKINEIQPIFDLYDSPSYFKFEIFGGVRMPIITFLFSSLQNLTTIVKFQTILSSIITLFFLLTIVKSLSTLTSRIIFYTLIMVLFSSPNVLYLDYYIMAESLNISSILLVLTTLFLYLKNPFSNFYLLLLILSLIIFSGIKSVNGFVSAFALIIILLKIFYNYKSRKIISTGFLIHANTFISIIFIPLTLFITLNISATPILNTSAIINSRLWENKEWRAYILNNKFPMEARTTFLNFSENNLGSPPDAAVANLESYKKWYENGGNRFLIRFMIDNLDYTFIAPFTMFNYSESKNLENTLLFGYSQGILNYQNIDSPQAVDLFNLDLFWPKDRIFKYINLSLFFIIISFTQIVLLIRQNKNSSHETIFTHLSISFAIIWSYLSWWFGSTPNDLPRHQFPVSVIIHILAVLNLCFLIDNLLKIKREHDQ